MNVDVDDVVPSEGLHGVTEATLPMLVISTGEQVEEGEVRARSRVHVTGLGDA